MKTSNRSKIALTLCAAVMAFQTFVIAGTIPVDLPRPDGDAGVKNNPVKVYILSGQSNMVGFGRLTGAAPVYPSIYLSADPSVMPCKMPVGPSALLPHGIYQSDKANAKKGAKVSIYKGAYDPAVDYSKKIPVKKTTVALGAVSASLPTIKGPHTVVVKAYIDVPMSGAHQLHAGFGDSTHAIVTLDGKEVYRRDVGGEEDIEKVNLQTGKRYPVTITYMKAGSAAFWMELVDIKGKGDLESLVKNEGKFAWMMDEKGEWTVRNDVILCESYLDDKKFKGGRSTPLSATANGKHIGPELGFGYVMGTFHDEPVLLIKADIGNRSIGWDCLPPGSKRFEFTEKDRKTGQMKAFVYAGYKDSPDKWEKGMDPEPMGWYAGKQYDEYTAAIRGVLDNFDTLYPQYMDQGYEVAGFVWWQGHKDGGSDAHISRYEQNMVNLIKAWRKEFKAPDAKWVIATVAFGGWDMSEKYNAIAAAQLAVSGETGKHPEFRGNVKTIEARDFWRPQAESPTGTGYHYNHNAETYMLTGDALGRAMVELQGGRAQARPIEPRPSNYKKMTPSEMIYTDAFINPWQQGEDEPTAGQFAEMAPAISPMILGALIPAYVAEAPRVPRYRRHGMSVVPIVSGNRPKDIREIPQELRSQLDLIINYYNAAGMNDYNWKRFGPDMRNANWEYFSFDPPEKQDLAKSGRYRKVTYPPGMENWFAVDFNAAKRGFHKGASPFGQNNGELKALSTRCTQSFCGCGIKPKTLWDKEVLLMRQTFDIPQLKDDHRYRMVVGGSGHNFSGEGFAIYINGNLFAESTQGFFKRAGARGGYIYNDFIDEFKSGKVTIAVKSFLRHTGHVNKQSPPRGHLSVWLESVKIPAVVLETCKPKRNE